MEMWYENDESMKQEFQIYGLENQNNDKQKYESQERKSYFFNGFGGRQCVPIYCTMFYE